MARLDLHRFILLFSLLSSATNFLMTTNSQSRLRSRHFRPAVAGMDDVGSPSDDFKRSLWLGDTTLGGARLGQSAAQLHDPLHQLLLLVRIGARDNDSGSSERFHLLKPTVSVQEDWLARVRSWGEREISLRLSYRAHTPDSFRGLTEDGYRAPTEAVGTARKNQRIFAVWDTPPNAIQRTWYGLLSKLEDRESDGVLEDSEPTLVTLPSPSPRREWLPAPSGVDDPLLAGGAERVGQEWDLGATRWVSRSVKRFPNAHNNDENVVENDVGSDSDNWWVYPEEDNAMDSKPFSLESMFADDLDVESVPLVENSPYPDWTPSSTTEDDGFFPFVQATPSHRDRNPLWKQDTLSYQHHAPLWTKEGPNTKAMPVSKRRFRLPVRKKLFVYGRDDRQRVFLPQMRKFPFSNMARLSTGCTGTLVTPRHVLTAAHCVHNGLGFRDNLEKLKVEIPDTMGFKDYYAQKITIPTGWLREHRAPMRTRRQSSKRARYDYAVVRLKLAVTGRTKFLPLAVPRPGVLQMDFHFLAFPQHDQQLWRSVCLASEHMAVEDGNLIMTRCDAAVGNSGAAVFIRDPQGGLRVVGILSNTMHVGYHRSLLRYSIITALTWRKLADICSELGVLGRAYNVCPPLRHMRRSRFHSRIKLIPFFGKRSQTRWPQSRPWTLS